MAQFENATVVKEANIYYDGKVTSRTVYLPCGSRKTLGIMLPGEYEFNTGAKEHMEILSGEVDILLAGESEWKTYKAGEAFDVPANSSFKLNVKSVLDYCCSYLE